MIRKKMTVLMLAFFAVLLPELSPAGEVDLPKTGQTTCYDSSGNVIDCTNTGQDGDIQAGVEWPEPRFEDDGDGTVTDHLTGLIWLKNANCFGTRSWSQALADCNNLASGSCGLSDSSVAGDWHLPNIVELESLVNAEEPNSAAWLNTQGFIGVYWSDYWSATTYVEYTTSAWRVLMPYGYVSINDKLRNLHCVWPVRFGQTGPALTWKTGQTVVYATGDDGDLQHGVSWSEPRFEDNGDGTVTDHLTGLIWLKDANCFGQRSWSRALTDCNNLASGSCGLSDSSVAGDWHLPNRKELMSLIDYSQYNLALPQDHLFDNVQSFYWSATTAAHDTSIAWGVYVNWGHVHTVLPDKLNVLPYSPFIWPVRSGQVGALDHFTFSNIASPQTVDTPFEITITARDEYGNRVTEFDEEVSLSSNVGNVSPIVTQLDNGQKTLLVTLFDQGSVRLSCSAYGAQGYSNYFTVEGGITCQGSIWGGVVDLRGEPVWQAEVSLYDLQGVQIGSSYLTDTGGKFQFTGLACDTYELKVTKNGVQKEGINVTVTNNLGNVLPDIKLFLNAGTYGSPVLLVPGILGSTTEESAYNAWAPRLPAQLLDPHLKLFQPQTVGWKELTEYFNPRGFDVLDCPWDWRVESVSAYKNYLIPKIQDALELSTTGKVHIVAHSTGGLVVRAYIQSEDYNYDIDKFAMVGTPNLGSCNPYYIWEGGDPKTIDDIVDRGLSSFVNLYTNSVQNLWEETYNLRGWDDDNTLGIRQFVRTVTPSLRQLMNTEEFLTNSSVSMPWDVNTIGNENIWLKELNEDPDIGARMSKDGENDTVQVGLFVGFDSETIENIKVGDPDLPFFYEDGKPSQPEKKNVNWGNGDKTVPYSSATWPEEQGWAELQATTNAEEHSKLIKYFTSEIFDFLTEGAQPQSITRQSQASIDAEVNGTAKLSFSSVGSVRAYISDSTGNHAGVDPTTGGLVEQIPGSKVLFGVTGGSIEIENPVAGSYMITIFGETERDFHFKIGYEDDEKVDYVKVRGFCSGDPIILEVSVDHSTVPQIAIIPPAQQPTGLLADPYSYNGNDFTRLSWDASQEEGVSNYNIYAAFAFEPYFTKIATVPVVNTSFDTNDDWCGNPATPVRSYTITAVKNDGSESFFSEIVQNNDRDHDGVSDVEEVPYGTDLNNPDSDSDGLWDGEERRYGTDPLVKDTDGDQISDYDEIQGGSDPLDENSVPLLPCECDLNHDGSCNILDWPYFIEDWGRTDCNEPTVTCECDLNGDGNCNILDWPYFIEDWGRTDCPN